MYIYIYLRIYIYISPINLRRTTIHSKIQEQQLITQITKIIFQATSRRQTSIPSRQVITIPLRFFGLEESLAMTVISWIARPGSC